MLWRHPEPLVLASGSAIRCALLARAGLPVDVRPAQIDERALEAAAPDRAPEAVAQLLADAKAAAVAAAAPGRVVLAADQTLGCEGRLYAKAPDRAAARAQLRSLSGRTHALHSAVTVQVGGEVVFRHVAVALLDMRTLSDTFLDSYLDAVGDAACASVGGYQLEGIGVHLFERIEGDYFTILGLPLLPLLAYFRTA
ncbi:MAG: Maf family protein, partial [Dehalococcoidia bacterium]|nr:Maf family protein [Dehalococcoidia bacterium]